MGGSAAATRLYQHVMTFFPPFAPLAWKFSPGNAQSFPNLFVKTTREIIMLGCDPNEVSYKQAGPYVYMYTLYSIDMYLSPTDC